jgi:1-deoxy-D-xylulose-5-phosphate reductoisomerase
MTAGGSAPTLLNAANEILVQAFLEHRLPFTAIAVGVRACLDALAVVPIASLEDVFEADRGARAWTEDWVQRFAS